MAVLSDADRQEAFAIYMREPNGTYGAITKSEVRAAINAIDDYLNTNAAAINTAIPQPARSVLTQSQKANLLVAVVRQRYIKGA